MTTIILKPAPGMQVRDPFTKELLPTGGASKPRTSYWLRRLTAGDVVEVSAKPAPADAVPAAKPAASNKGK